MLKYNVLTDLLDNYSYTLLSTFTVLQRKVSCLKLHSSIDYTVTTVDTVWDHLKFHYGYLNRNFSVIYTY